MTALYFDLRPRAREDIRLAADWYYAASPTFAYRFVVELYAALERIEAYPESYAIVQNGIRRAALHDFPYVIYYRIKKDTIRILSVLHTSRNPQNWQRRN